MNKTLQRQAILRIINNSDRHLMADEVYRMATEHVPQITLATVYRNLKQLSNAGLINQVKLSELPQYFEKKTAVHFHIYCRHCRRIRDIDDDRSARLHKFMLDSMEEIDSESFALEFAETCSSCRKSAPKSSPAPKKEPLSLK